MGAEETKKDLILKRVQVTVAILGGIATLIVGVYNIRKHMLGQEEAAQPIVVQQPAQPPSALKSAIEEAGASWIKKLATAPSGPADTPAGSE